jgi:hypothetical protein
MLGKIERRAGGFVVNADHGMGIQPFLLRFRQDKAGRIDRGSRNRD